jgi:hypothetical protein
MMINKKLQEMAVDAGFAFWEDEAWGPGPGNIDWSSEYDQQLQCLYDIMLEEVLKTIDESTKSNTFTNFDATYLGTFNKKLKEDILKKFGV